MKTALIVAFLILPAVVFAQLNGTRTVCASGCDYTSLTLAGGAFAAINSVGINGNLVLEIRSDLTAETGANVLANFTDINGPHTITIRPQNNVMRTISGTNNAQGLIVLAGADRVIIDGRNPADPTLSYTNRYLTIRNTSTTASTLAVSNDAVSCSIRSTIIEGANVNTTGVVNVSGGSISGNDDLNIDYCDIKDGASLPRISITMDGGSQSNDNVQITNNRIFNFFTTANGGTGINIGNLNSNILILGNSIYQTADRTSNVNLTYRCISINSTGSGFNILNNFLGGSAEGATGTVRSISATGNRWVNVKMIDIVEVGTATPSLISGNTIRGISTSSTASATNTEANLIGIAVTRGAVNVRNNTIGGTIANSNLTATFNAGSVICTGLISGIVFRTDVSGTGIIGDIDGNTIDNLQMNVSGATSPSNSALAGIYIVRSTGTNTITIKKNLIGRISGTPAFTIGSVAAPPGSILLYGILYSGNLGSTIIERNKIANLSSGATDSNTGVYGIRVSNPLDIQVVENEIFNISSGVTLNANTTGIYASLVGSGQASISRNTLYGINTGSGAGSNGIMLHVSSATNIPLISNNMVTMGSASATNNSYKGLYVWGSAGSVNIFANSVAIVGTATSSQATTGLFRLFTSGFAPPVNLRANIFLNTRTGGSGVHNTLVSSGVNHTGITSNYNLLFCSVAGNLTDMNGTARNYATWQSATGQDANSYNFNISPKFINTATGNLRIPDDGSADVTNNIVDKGAANAGANPVSIDIDNATRTNITDIGASEVMVMWLGTTNSTWTTTTNWSGGIVPSCGGRELVKIGPNIPGVVLNQPTISTTANFRDLIILEGATVTLTNPGALTQCATGVSPYSLTNTGTIVAGGRPITLYGDFIQNGTYTPGGGSVSLIAASAQSIKGDVNPLAFNNLTISGGGAKTLQQAVRVDGLLSLTNGVVNTSTAYPLALSTTGTYTGGSNTSYINGPMAKQTNSVSLFAFPIGKGGKIRPAIIEPSNTLTSTFSAEYFNQSAIDNIGTNMDGSIVTVSDIEYWRINRIGSANGFVTLTWDAASSVSANQVDRDLLGVVRWNGFQWSNHYQNSNTGTQASGQVTSTFIGVFDTYFTLGSSTTNNPLPIVLDYFRVGLGEGQVLAEWATEEEELFDRFELEKASTDLVFTKIAEIKSLASGEPKTYRKYAHIDPTPYLGYNYYRLKAIDLDGSYQYFRVERVFYEGDKTRGQEINVYPNPILTSQLLKVKIPFTPTPQDKVSLMTMQGVEVQNAAIEAGDTEIELSNQVKPGVYILRYNSPAFQKTFKIVVK